jgi:hypothetical protein
MQAHFVSIRRGDAKIGLDFVYPESRRELAKIGLYFEPAKIV